MSLMRSASMESGQSAHEELPSWWEHIEEWIPKLKRELELEDFGQNAAAGSVTSASAKTEHALSVGAAPTAIVDSVVVSEGATSQLAGDDDGACAQTQLAFDRSSSAGHVASTPAEPEHSFPFNAVWTAVNGAVAGAHRFPTG
ncbi:hypothetical protein K466DRAFT_598806 [Polyporus arcularius HHB13444]|uniref:Uncharacterized protein n=1 Tax=Polyporus arcularius HHB13444 TaxID=1314778 RepID=A0A5C3PGU4_9APHY|nr:hypothetical protein K466DRAFT_598806 [Polyporus arcularius HHB13444]